MTVKLSCDYFCNYIYFILFFINYYLFNLFCDLFLAFKLEFPFGGSKSVCIRPLDDNTDVKMLVMCRHCYTKERKLRLGQIHHFCCYFMLFVSNTRILSLLSSGSKVFHKKRQPHKFRKIYKHRKTTTPELPFQ